MPTAIKLTGDLADEAQALLGEGTNLTPKRVKSLFEELRALRGKEVGTERPPKPDPDEPAPAPEPEPAQDEPAPAPVQAALPAPVTAEDMALAKIRELEAEIKRLSRPPSSEETERAVGDGRLPPPAAVPAPPLDLTGLQDITRGKWMISPFGPKVFFILCGCKQCKPYRFDHWYCCICKGGPFHYKQHYPHYKKEHMAPGGVWGILHTTCSEPCRIAYLSKLGVVSGVNDHEPPQVTDEGILRPAMAPDSD